MSSRKSTYLHVLAVFCSTSSTEKQSNIKLAHDNKILQTIRDNFKENTPRFIRNAIKLLVNRKSKKSSPAALIFRLPVLINENIDKSLKCGFCFMLFLLHLEKKFLSDRYKHVVSEYFGLSFNILGQVLFKIS